MKKLKNYNPELSRYKLLNEFIEKSTQDKYCLFYQYRLKDMDALLQEIYMEKSLLRNMCLINEGYYENGDVMYQVEIEPILLEDLDYWKKA